MRWISGSKGTRNRSGAQPPNKGCPIVNASRQYAGIHTVGFITVLMIASQERRGIYESQISGRVVGKPDKCIPTDCYFQSMVSWLPDKYPIYQATRTHSPYFPPLLYSRHLLAIAFPQIGRCHTSVDRQEFGKVRFHETLVKTVCSGKAATLV